MSFYPVTAKHNGNGQILANEFFTKTKQYKRVANSYLEIANEIKNYPSLAQTKGSQLTAYKKQMDLINKAITTFIETNIGQLDDTTATEILDEHGEILKLQETINKTAQAVAKVGSPLEQKHNPLVPVSLSRSTGISQNLSSFASANSAFSTPNRSAPALPKPVPTPLNNGNDSFVDELSLLSGESPVPVLEVVSPEANTLLELLSIQDQYENLTKAFQKIQDSPQDLAFIEKYIKIYLDPQNAWFTISKSGETFQVLHTMSEAGKQAVEALNEERSVSRVEQQSQKSILLRQICSLDRKIDLTEKSAHTLSLDEQQVLKNLKALRDKFEDSLKVRDPNDRVDSAVKELVSQQIADAKALMESSKLDYYPSVFCNNPRKLPQPESPPKPTTASSSFESNLALLKSLTAPSKDTVSFKAFEPLFGQPRASQPSSSQTAPPTSSLLSYYLPTINSVDYLSDSDDDVKSSR